MKDSASLMAKLIAKLRSGGVIAAWTSALLLCGWWQAPPPIAGQSANPVAVVSAASYGATLTPESIAAAFGVRMATRTEVARTSPLPTVLAGTTVRVNGQAAPLFFVSPGQINFLIPAGVPAGTAGISVTAEDGTVSTGTINIATTAPALFTANASGRGVLAALLLRRKFSGATFQDSYEPVAQFDQAEARYVTRPLSFGEESDQLFLLLFLSGIRQAPLGGVRVNLGGVDYAPLYSGPQGELAGLDQINLALPRSFSGRGRVNLFVRAAGSGASNSGELELAGATASESNAPLQLTSVGTAPLEVGQEVEISGTGFAANPRENTVQIVADDGVTAKAEVLGVSGNGLRMRVPFGAGTGQLKVARGNAEGSLPVRVKTSVSGFIERVGDSGARIAIAGARVRIITQANVPDAVANADGSFVMSGINPQARADFKILPPVSGALNYPEKPFTLRIYPAIHFC